MPDPVSSIRNLGPAFEQACARAGIHSAQELRDLGPDEAYTRVLRAGARPHFIGYYVLVMGLQGRPWNDCKGAEKKALRERFDRIKASVSAAPALQLVSELDAIGVRVTPADLKPDR
ncbi:TfoX/Sxy family protein [Ruegeria sediminis]|uniref:TfoX/Sxy family protein n=1 Tax=Ruegeria sediminis TaxID=2583820 RepID=A0ABY2WW54_9RHOB|nr:TfoX/Sxy family protein [Ruegeria sediminis]TMV06531.1 TfoX/Sxy family protein [Ruegeria sediminis]